MAQPKKWDDDFEKEFYSDDEIVDSDVRVKEIQDTIDVGHGGMLAFERVAVDA